jgi:hypothetical protein
LFASRPAFFKFTASGCIVLGGLTMAYRLVWMHRID